MDTTQQPEALAELRERLRSFEADHTPDGWPAVRMRDITALLDDLDNARSDNQVLRLGYAAARLEIESLKAQLHAAKQINAAQFGLLAASIPGSALRASHGQAPATQQAGEVRRAELVPGVMHCAKCKFQLNRVTLCVSDGNAYAGNNKTEPCPNGCGPLWPVTWEQEAKNCWKALEEMHERLMAAAAPQPPPRHRRHQAQS